MNSQDNFKHIKNLPLRHSRENGNLDLYGCKDSRLRGNDSIIKNWLIICAVLVFCMIIIGGLTRLTESGLSIVEWKLVSGILPPLTHESWQAEFSAYQTSPEYDLVNNHFNIDEFKNIFWLEYIHRLLGRLVGIIFIIPLIWFAFRKTISKHLRLNMIIITALVGLQGIVGWYMVKSGLNDVPWVSPYRLAFHMGLATVIFLGLLWQIFSLNAKNNKVIKIPIPKSLTIIAKTLFGLVFVQILMGALVAGLDAGLTYNTFPLMDGEFIPDGILLQTPIIINFFENIATVQFQHRITAFAVLAIAGYLYMKLNSTSNNKRILKTIGIIITIIAMQIVVGITTLLLVVPTHIASLHQVIAIILISFCLKLIYQLKTKSKA